MFDDTALTAALYAAAHYLEHEPALYHCGIDTLDSTV